MSLSINHREQKKQLINIFSCEWFIGKNLKIFLGLIKGGRVYNFFALAFFVNISTPPSFQDEPLFSLFHRKAYNFEFERRH